VIRAVLFDMGGTLLDFNPHRLQWLEWERGGMESVHTYLVNRGYSLTGSTFFAHLIDSLAERWAEATQGGRNLHLAERIRAACTACGVSPTRDEIDQAVAQYIAPLDKRVVIYSDAVQTLRLLRERGLKTALVSNTMWPGTFHRRQLRRFELLPYLDHTVFSADLSIWKPQPGIYQHALDALSVDPGEAIFVGNSIAEDVAGAQAAGMRGVWKHDPGFFSDGVHPDATITHLAELIAWVDRWQGHE